MKHRLGSLYKTVACACSYSKCVRESKLRVLVLIPSACVNACVCVCARACVCVGARARSVPVSLLLYVCVFVSLFASVCAADAIMGVTFFGDEAPEDFGTYDLAFVTVFSMTAGNSWVSSSLGVCVWVFQCSLPRLLFTCVMSRRRHERTDAYAHARARTHTQNYPKRYRATPSPR